MGGYCWVCRRDEVQPDRSCRKCGNWHPKVVHRSDEHVCAENLVLGGECGVCGATGVDRKGGAA